MEFQKGLKLELDIREKVEGPIDRAIITTLERVQSSDVEELAIENLHTQEGAGYGDRDPTSTKSGSLQLAPQWVYGTTFPLPSSSRDLSTSGSGLSLAARGQLAIAQPEVTQNFLFPLSEALKEKIIRYRQNLVNLLSGDIGSVENNGFKNPLLVVAGPDFVQNPNQIKACAQWVGKFIGKKFSDLPREDMLPPQVASLYHCEDSLKYKNLMFAIRTNLSKYNHDYNQINDKINSVMTYEIEQGIPICRALLCELAEICPIVGDPSDTITPQYLSDLYCLGFVSSTLIESQLHRELVSGLSYSIGFHTLDCNLIFNKDIYKHKINCALDAMFASSQKHQFLSVTKIGTVAVVGTIGNEDTFAILQINSELHLEDLVELIDTIYMHPKLKFSSPRIMLDVGKIKEVEYNDKLSIMKHLMTDIRTKYKIIGVLIDSGENYIPKGYHIELNEKLDTLYIDSTFDSFDLEFHTENMQAHEKLIQLNKYFVRNRIFKTINKGSKSDITSSVSEALSSAITNEHLYNYYEYFINADRFIEELANLSDARTSQ